MEHFPAGRMLDEIKKRLAVTMHSKSSLSLLLSMLLNVDSGIWFTLSADINLGKL